MEREGRGREGRQKVTAPHVPSPDTNLSTAALLALWLHLLRQTHALWCFKSVL